MNIGSLKHNPENPRTCTDSRKRQLLKAYRTFGDLSGIVYNRKTKHLVCGHRRSELFEPETPIVALRTYSKPTKTGTVAQGYLEIKGEHISYREVYWDAQTEKAAAIAANNNAGDWDMPQLGRWLKELSSFDVDFDLELTMFTSEELLDIPIPIDVAGHTRKPSEGKEEEPETPEEPPKCKHGEIYDLGEIRLKCAGSDEDLRFCDFVIARWKRKTGLEPVLVRAVSKRRPAGQGKGRADAAQTAT